MPYTRRIEQALATIQTICGQDERGEIDAKMQKSTLALAGYESDLEIGGFRGFFNVLKSDAETERRKAVRALLFARLVLGQLQHAGVAQAKSAMLGTATQHLANQLKQLFPYKPFAGSFKNRAAWAPFGTNGSTFTDPKLHRDAAFQYVVSGLRNYPIQVAVLADAGNPGEMERYFKEVGRFGDWGVTKRTNRWDGDKQAKGYVRFDLKYLADPSLFQHDVISSSLIDQNHRQTFTAFGFILAVPAECVYVTAHADAGVDNRTGDIVREMERVQSANSGTIRTPAALLALTNLYNEVVLAGTSPEAKHVRASALFVKTSVNGKMADLGKGGGATADIYEAILECSERFGLPIVRIADSTVTDTWTEPQRRRNSLSDRGGTDALRKEPVRQRGGSFRR